VPLALKLGDLITIQRHGGELTFDRDVYTAIEPSFPRFAVGEDYVVALKRESGSDAFFVVGGGQGAFRVGSDLVLRQVTHYPGETPEERPSLDLPLDQIRDRIKAFASR
jgi:hypothetical protein